jgi:hypothetical protein
MGCDEPSLYGGGEFRIHVGWIPRLLMVQNRWFRSGKGKGRLECEVVPPDSCEWRRLVKGWSPQY